MSDGEMPSLLDSIQRDLPKLNWLGERDPKKPVPSCPGWEVGDLCQHLDETCRDVLTELGVSTDGAGLAAALDGVMASGVNPEDVRLQGLAEEAAIHLWDAQGAFGEAEPLHADIACRGVDGFFTLAAPGVLRYRGAPAGHGEQLHLHRTDGPGEWLILLEELPQLTHEHAPADVTISGSASDLLLCLWGRVEPPDVSGDAEIWRRFRKVSKH